MGHYRLHLSLGGCHPAGGVYDGPVRFEAGVCIHGCDVRARLDALFDRPDLHTADYFPGYSGVRRGNGRSNRDGDGIQACAAGTPGLDHGHAGDSNAACSCARTGAVRVAGGVCKLALDLPDQRADWGCGHYSRH
ncbi:hypothetical protein D3C75_1001260 [compost metagenome]